MNANRRLQERKQPEQIVLCKLGGEKSSSVLNLSEDGLCFESLTPIEETDLLHLHLSADLNGAIEAAGRLAWIDSAKRTGGLRFVELSTSAREQIRAWLSETSIASGGRSGGAFLQKVDKQADDGAATGQLVVWQDRRLRSLQLVPIERHRAQKCRHFLGGLLVGFGICAALMVPIFRYAGGMKPGSLAWTIESASHAAQSSAEQTPASAVHSVPPSASISESTARKALAPPPVVQKVSVAEPTRSPRRQSPQTAQGFSTAPMRGTASPSAAPQPGKAEQPLGASQAAVLPAPDASKAHSSSGQVEHAKKVSATPQQLWSALQAGNIKAAVALADLYARGEGVPVNCEQARVLLLAASEKNNAEASKKLRDLKEGGCPANSD